MWYIWTRAYNTLQGGGRGRDRRQHGLPQAVLHTGMHVLLLCAGSYCAAALGDASCLPEARRIAQGCERDCCQFLASSQTDRDSRVSIYSSPQGGMGAAMLSTPDLAKEVCTAPLCTDLEVWRVHGRSVLTAMLWVTVCCVCVLSLLADNCLYMTFPRSTPPPIRSSRRWSERSSCRSRQRCGSSTPRRSAWPLPR